MGAKLHDKVLTLHDGVAGPLVVDLNAEPPGAGKGAAKPKIFHFED